MGNRYKKPPIGILNREAYEKFLKEDIDINGGMSLLEVKKQRLNDLQGAILRYSQAKIHIDIEWIKEYNELLCDFGVNKIEFKL